MKIKKLFSVLSILMLSFASIFFGCKGKYDNFSIYVEGETSIVLNASSTVETDRTYEVTIKFKNAPNKNCKNVTAKALTPNILLIEATEKNDKYIKFKISPLENLSSDDLSTDVVFTSAEGDKTCKVNVKIVIEITNLLEKENYSPFVVADGNYYALNTSKAFTFEPSNTTQKEIVYSLVDETLSERYGLEVLKDGRIKIEKLLDNDGVGISSFEVLATSAYNQNLSKVLNVQVLKEITYQDFSIITNGADSNLATKYYELSNEDYEKLTDAEKERYARENFETLTENGIVLSSNNEVKKTSLFQVVLNATSGLTKDSLNIYLEKYILNNATIDKNSFLITALNPNVDYLKLVISYKNFEDYKLTLVVPVEVRENATEISVNSSNKTSYDIFDYYDNLLGQPFKVTIGKNNAYDRTFKIEMDKQDFNKFVLTYKDNQLSLNDFEEIQGKLISKHNFENNSIIYIKAKMGQNTDATSTIKFIANGGIELESEIELKIAEGVTSLSFATNKQTLFIAKGESLILNGEEGLNYKVNGTDVGDKLLDKISLVSSEENVLEIGKDTTKYRYLLKGKVTGTTKIKLVAENGVESDELEVVVYNYSSEDELDKVFGVEFGANLKQVEDKYYLGLESETKLANITIKNDKNITINLANVEVLDENVLSAYKVSENGLIYRVQALTKGETTIKISVKIYNDNSLVNGEELTKTLEKEITVKTYYPITDVSLKKDKIEVIDGADLDIDSLQNKLNVLNIADILEISKNVEDNDDDDNLIKIDYNIPSGYSVYNENSSTNNVSKESADIIVGNDYSLTFNFGDKGFSNGVHSLFITAKVYDISKSEYHPITFKVDVKAQVKPYMVNISGTDGFVYLTNETLFYELNAEVVSETSQEVTNKNLKYEVLTNQDLIKEGIRNESVDENILSINEEGIITVKASGKTKIKVSAKASKYKENGEYSIYKIIDVIIADGSESLPYILSDFSQIKTNKHYTLNSNLNVENKVETFDGSIDGDFAYKKYSNNTQTGKYKLFSSISGVMFENLNGTIKNVDVVIDYFANNQNEYSLFVENNNGAIKNVSLTYNANFKFNFQDETAIGLIACKNDGTIEKCSVDGNLQITTSNNLIFGGLVGENYKDVLGGYNYFGTQNNIVYNSSLNVSINTTGGNIIVGGLIGASYNNSNVKNLSARVVIHSNASVLGGIVGSAESANIENCLFSGVLNSNANSCKLGGIIGKAINASLNLCFVQFTFKDTLLISTEKAFLSANGSVGGLVGSGEGNEVTITNSYVQSLVKYENLNLVADIYATNYVGGLIGEVSDNTQANISIAFSDVKIFADSSKTNYVGGLISKANKFRIENVYSSVEVNSQSNVGGLISKTGTNSSSTISNAYTTTATNVVKDGISGITNVYTSNQIGEMISSTNFSTSPWKRDYTINSGLPYLVFGSYNFLMQEPQSINAKFVANNKVNANSNYYYGANENVIIINDDDKQNKALIYFTDNLQFENINDLIDIVIYPENSVYNIVSSDTSVLSIINGTRIKINKTGNVTIKIYYSNGSEEISSEVYISVVEKVEKLSVENSFKILNGKTKQLNVALTGKNAGLEFSFDDDVSQNLLYNNSEIENDKIYTTSTQHIFTALKTGEFEYSLTPFYNVMFGNESYKVKDYDFEKTNLKLIIETGATGISTHTSSIYLTEKEVISFDIQVENETNENGLKINFNGTEQKFEGENLNKEISTTVGENIIVSKVLDISNNKFTISVSVNGNIDEQKVVELKISPLSNENLNVSVLVNLMPSRLLNVELVHYNTISNIDGKSSIKSTPSSTITPGELGVLQINLHPSFANMKKVLVKSDAVNGTSIQLAQLALDANNNLVYVKNNGTEEGALLLDYSTSIITSSGKEFDGNLYVSTILPSNVAINTIFTITVICFDALDSEPITQTIELKAIPLPGAYLAKNNETSIQMAKGTELVLDLVKVNIETEIEPSYEILVENRALSSEDAQNIKLTDVYENGTKVRNKVLLYVDILTKVASFDIKTSVRTYINGKLEIVENITKISVVDYVINDAYVENAENSIIENNVGANTLLKVKLDVTSASEELFLQKRVGETDDEYQERVSDSRLELERITLRIKAMEESISKMSSTFNTLTKNQNDTYVYSNIVPNVEYSNFKTFEEDGYLVLSGTKVSSQQIVMIINYNYDLNGLVKLTTNAGYEINKNLYLEVKTYTTKDNPSPITTYEQFTQMKEGESYILLKDITLPKDYRPQNANFESLDGNGYTINLQGFSLVESDVNVGVFSEIQKDTVVKNLKINILPNIFYLDNIYEYGFEVDALGLQQLNFGVLCGTNYGVITNCSVVNENELTQKREVSISVKSEENTNINVSLFVAKNEGYITNSRVNNKTENSQPIAMQAKANIGGFVVENSNKIASSFVTNISLINKSQQLKTAGFVVTNNSQVITSFVEGNFQNANSEGRILSGGIGAVGNVGGFVYENNGNIQNSYSNLPITTNMRSAGFVYDNTKGKISTCFSASKIQIESSSHRYFTGNNEENIVLNTKGGIKNSYYLSTAQIKGSDLSEYDEPANGIEGFDEKSLEGFVCGTNGIWEITNKLPTLIDATSTIFVQRKLLDDNQLNDASAKIYNYTYVNYELGTEKNPIIVSTTQEFIDALTNEDNLYSYYMLGRKIKTNINYKHIRIVKDIDLSTIVKDGESLDSQEEVQKLQNIIFAGNLNGNGLDIDNIIITARSSDADYDSFGLFKQVGVDFVYNANKSTENSLLDEDNCSVVKNINFNISSISATITRSVGVLTGEVINTKLYNINVVDNGGVVVTGKNMVGGVAGRISGKSKVGGVTSNVSVLATYSSETDRNVYEELNTKKINNVNYSSIVDTTNNKIGYAGGLFGVVDIYDVKIDNLSETLNSYSKQITVEVARNFDESIGIDNNHISYAKVYDDVQIYGEISGGLFGLIGTNSAVHDVQFELIESNTQNVIASFSAGGIAGENRGLLNYAVVSLEKYSQDEIDRSKTETELRGMLNYLFSSTSNTATYVGGLVGMNRNGEISYSYNRANVVAKNSRYVGGLVGLFDEGKITYAYTTSNVVAQNEIKSSDGYITQLKGYAGGIIGRLNSVLNSGFDISNVVGANNFDLETSKEYNLTYFAGYNAMDQVAMLNNFETSGKTLNASIGASLTVSPSETPSFKDYKDKANNCFVNFSSDDNWDVQNFIFPVLTYNAKSVSKSISSEEDLRNMTSGGSYTLVKDIYLTSPWSPLYAERVNLTSAKRDSEEIAIHGTEYYKIYNLNILTNEKALSSDNISGNIGFFSTLTNSQVSNITFVVGTNYKDPQDSKKAPDRNVSDRIIDKENWGKYSEFGILIENKISDYNLGVLAGTITGGSTINNVSIINGNGSQENTIKTNLSNVGILAGYINEANITEIYVNKLPKFDNEYYFAINALNSNKEVSNVGSLAGRIESARVSKVEIAKVEIKKTSQSSNLGLIAGNANNATLSNISVSNSTLSFKTNSETSKENNENLELKVGYGFGSIQNSNEDFVLGKQFSFENCKIDVTTANAIYAGGFAGEVINSSVFGVDISRNSSIEISMIADIPVNAYVGGLVGLGYTKNENYTIQNCSSNGMINFEYNGNANTSAFVGGLVGRNGYTEETKDGNASSVKKSYNGITLGSSDNSTYSKVRIYLSKTITEITNSYEVYVGGIAGYNNANVTNVISLSTIKSLTNDTFTTDNETTKRNSTISGGIAKHEETGNEIDNVSYAKDLSGVPIRDEEFGVEAKTYSDILLNDLTVLSFDSDKATTENKGYSILNPIELDNGNWSDFVEELNGMDEEDQEFKYYVLTENVINDNTIENFNGVLIGNSNTITLNKTLFNKLGKHALISNINLVAKTLKINSYELSLETDCLNSNTTLANENKGIIFDVCVAGNLYYQFTQQNNNWNDNKVGISSFVVKNFGTIVNCSSKVNVLISRNTTGLSSNDISAIENNIAGFTNENEGLILNSFSTSNIEVFDLKRDISYVSSNKKFQNISGFVNNNNKFIINCYSATTLPNSETPLTAFNILGNGSVENCFFDYNASAYFYSQENRNNAEKATKADTKDFTKKESESKETNKTIAEKFAPYSNVWAQDNKINYSYIYINYNNNILSTFSDDNGYEINNIGTLLNVENILKSESETSIKFILVRNINANIVEVTDNNPSDPLITFASIDLSEKEVTFNGNNFAIKNVNIDNAKSSNLEMGLFYNDGESQATIENLAVINLNYQLRKLQSNIYIGGIVAKGNISLKACYADGIITTNFGDEDERTTQDTTKEANLYVGGLCGETSGEISNCFNNVKINLNENFENSTAYVGGISGKSNNSITNSVSASQIRVRTLDKLYMGGISGLVKASSEISLTNLYSLSPVAYDGYYKHYYEEFDAGNKNNSTLHYNINAVFGKVEVESEGQVQIQEDTIKYNEKLSLTKDNKIPSSNLLESSGNFFANGLSINNNFAKAGKSSYVLNSTDGTILNPIILTSVDKNTKFENGKNYIVNIESLKLEKRNEGSEEIIIGEYEFEDGFIIFNNNGSNVKVDVTSGVSLFKTLKNATVVGIDFVGEENKCIIANGILANSVVSSTINNINVNDLYITDNTNSVEENYTGMLVNNLSDSIIANVSINHGRFNANSGIQRSGIAGIVGKAESSTLFNLTNSATITSTQNCNNVAGIVAMAENSSLNFITNNGLVYNNNGKVSAGICAECNDSTISFSKNTEKVQISHPNEQTKVCASGLIASTGKITMFYCFNEGDVISIGSRNSYSTGLICDDSDVEIKYSYNKGPIVSTGTIYALTNANASISNKVVVDYSYNIGGGYSLRATSLGLTGGGEEKCKALVGIDELMKTETDEVTTMTYAQQIAKDNKDFIMGTTEDSGDKKLIFPVIAAIDEIYELKEENGIFQISTAFDLYYWLSYVASGNVEILKDIDMSGYNISPKLTEYTGVFNGNNHQISDIRIFEGNRETDTETGKSSVYVGFIAKNRGTIQNINFVDPQITLNQTGSIEDNKSKVFAETTYIGVVAGENFGTIENVMLSASRDDVEFISSNYKGGHERDNDTVYVGTITGANSGTISYCEVINLFNGATIDVDYKFINSASSGSIFTANTGTFNICVGGIAGRTDNSNISNCSHFGYISVVADNSGQYSYNDWWLDLLPTTTPVENINAFISPIVGTKGSNGVSVSDNYAKHNLNNASLMAKDSSTIIGYSIKNSDQTQTNNLTKLVGTNGDITEDGIGKYLQNGSGTISSNQIKANAWQNLGNGNLPTSTIYFDTNKVVLDNTEYNHIDDSSSYQSLEKTNAYGNFEGEGENSVLNNGIFKMFSYIVNGTTAENKNKVLNTEVYILEKLILHENIYSVPEIDNGKYYIKTADELAYAFQITGDATFVLMNTIDLTKRIWNETKDTSNIKIIDNGFDILYTKEGIAIGNKVTSRNPTEDFGANKKIQKDEKQAKLYSFGCHFNEFKDNNNSIYDGSTTFTITKKEQLYLIGFYLHKFSDSALKTTLDFSGITFELGNSIVLDFVEDFRTRDENEKTKSMQEVISEKLGAYGITKEDVYSGEHSYFKGIDAYYGKRESYIETCLFGGTFNGNGNTITIKNGVLFNELGESANVYNLNVNVETSSDVTLNRTYSDFGFVANVNKGNISNVNVKVNVKTTGLNINKTIQLATLDENGTKTYETNVNDVTNFGLICGVNQGKIENCTVTNTNGDKVNKVDGLNINFKHKVIGESDGEIKFNFHENIGAFVGSNEGKISFEDDISDVNIEIKNDNDTPKNLTIALGSICGQNVICSEKSYSSTQVMDLGVYNAKVLQSTLTVNSENTYQVYVGGIAGISSTNIKNCSVTKFSSENGSNAKVGIIVGRFNAELYLEDSTVHGESYYYTCFVPKIVNCYGTSPNGFELCGEIATLYYGVAKVEVKENGTVIGYVYYIETSLDGENYEPLLLLTTNKENEKVKIYIDSAKSSNQDISQIEYNSSAIPTVDVKKITLKTVYNDINWGNAENNDKDALENYSGRTNVTLTLDGIDLGSEFTIVATRDAEKELKVKIDYFDSEMEIEEKTGEEQTIENGYYVYKFVEEIDGEEKTFYKYVGVDNDEDVLYRYTGENGSIVETPENPKSDADYKAIMEDIIETRKYQNELTLNDATLENSSTTIKLNEISSDKTITFTVTLEKTYPRNSETTGE